MEAELKEKSFTTTFLAGQTGVEGPGIFVYAFVVPWQ